MTEQFLHFEELWDKCEAFQKEASAPMDVASIVSELQMKVSLYKAIDLRTELPEEERTKLKARTMGEILLVITSISVKDNINVFECLTEALQYRSIDHFNRKHPVI